MKIDLHLSLYFKYYNIIKSLPLLQESVCPEA
jgi:hypothetical protein